MVSEDRLQRARSALDELESGEMEVTPTGDGTFEVKDYEVEIGEVSCECKDHEYNERFCKHIVAAQLQAMWGNVDMDIAMGDTDPPKPDVLSPKLDNVPEYLREQNQWVCWKQKLHENKDGSKRWTKVPVDPHTGGFASSTDAETWSSFSTAVGHFNTVEEVVGVGFVVGDDFDDVIGVDIDDCRDPDSGAMDEVVHEILSEVDTYGEVSPSGTGVRIFVRGEPSVEECEADLPGEAHIERYTTGRYLTVTGHQLLALPDEVNHDKSTIAEVDRRMRS